MSASAYARVFVLFAVLAGSATVHVWAQTTYSTNLIVNGDAEFGGATIVGTDAVTIPGWSVTGNPTVVRYGVSGFPSAATGGPPDRGKNFFAGGAEGDSSVTQAVKLGAAAAVIDQGVVHFSLSGWLGGKGTRNDNAALIVTFYDHDGIDVGSWKVGPVFASDRGDATQLLYRSMTGTVPIGSRTARVTLRMENVGPGPGNTAYADDLMLRLSQPMPPIAEPTPYPARVPRFDHIFLIYMENQSYSEIIGNVRQAPFLNRLARANAIAANYYALLHPSDPNYVAQIGGSRFDLKGNDTPHVIHAKNLMDEIEASGRTWRGYSQGARGPCDEHTYGQNPSDKTFGWDDLPFFFFADIRDTARCKDVVPLTQLALDFSKIVTTPSFAWIAADDCNDMEGCGIAAGDRWLRRTLQSLFDSPAWKRQNCLLIITWDEDDRAHGQHIPTLLIGPHVKPHAISRVRYTHYSTLRTIEAAWGLPPLTKNDAYAVPMNDVWR